MFMLYGVLIGLVAGRLAGGRVAGLAGVRLRWVPLVAAGLAIQLVLFAGPVSDRVGDLGPWIYVGSTGLVLAAILANLAVPGLPVVAAGAIANLAAIVANGGYMPANPAALAAAGHHIGAAYTNSSLALDPSLELLTDRFAMPSWLPFANVFSVGDVLISIGIVVTIVLAMRSTAEPGV